RKGNLLRRQGVRSGKSFRLPQEPVDQARRGLSNSRAEQRANSAMQMPVMKIEPVPPVTSLTAQVLPLTTAKRTSLTTTIAAKAGNIAAGIVPPAVVIAIALLIWELLCRRAGSTLPPPSKVISDTWELIRDPFFDRGGLDKGLFW